MPPFLPSTLIHTPYSDRTYWRLYTYARYIYIYDIFYIFEPSQKKKKKSTCFFCTSEYCCTFFRLHSHAEPREVGAAARRHVVKVHQDRAHALPAVLSEPPAVLRVQVERVPVVGVLLRGVIPPDLLYDDKKSDVFVGGCWWRWCWKK